MDNNTHKLLRISTELYTYIHVVNIDTQYNRAVCLCYEDASFKLHMCMCLSKGIYSGSAKTYVLLTTPWSTESFDCNGPWSTDCNSECVTLN